MRLRYINTIDQYQRILKTMRNSWKKVSLKAIKQDDASGTSIREVSQLQITKSWDNK